eukprot:1420895-Amphidinium_carterae.1
MQLTQLVKGGAREHRVQHTLVAQSAFEKLVADLALTPQGLVVEHRFAQHILETDSKATRA